MNTPPTDPSHYVVELNTATGEVSARPVTPADRDRVLPEAVASRLMLRLGQEIMDTLDYQAACRVIREFTIMSDTTDDTAAITPETGPSC